MSFGGSKFPPLPPLTPPTPVDKSTLTAELQAQGRRSGLRAAMLSRLGVNQNQGSNRNTKLSGGS